MKNIFLIVLLFTINYCNAQTKKERQKNEKSWRIIRASPFDSIRSNIIGKWKDQNSTTIFFYNGVYSTKFANGKKEIGTWKNTSKQITFSANGISIDDVYNILYISNSLMKTQLSNGADTTIWVAKKISQ